MPTLYSRFHFAGYLLGGGLFVFYFIVMPVLLLGPFRGDILSTGTELEWIFMIALPGLCIGGVVYWLLVVRFWALRVELNEFSIKVKDAFGWGGTREWLLHELDGYTYKKKYVKYMGVKERMIVWRNGKKAFELFEPFYDNYEELKEAISSRIHPLQN